jgi:hypothetical protein
MGNMSYNKYEQGFPIDECPIIDVNINNIETKLKATIEDYTLRCKLAARANEYVAKFLTVQGLVEKIVRIYNGENVPYDYTPRFFYSRYIPESEAAIDEFNKWNTYVNDCKWYMNLIPKGERNSIKF